MLCTSVVLLTSLLCYCRGSLLASDHDSSPSGHADPSAVLEQRFPLPGGWVCDHTCLPLQAQPVSLTHPQNRAPCSRPCFCAIVCGFPLPERNLPILSTQRTPVILKIHLTTCVTSAPLVSWVLCIQQAATHHLLCSSVTCSLSFWTLSFLRTEIATHLPGISEYL